MSERRDDQYLVDLLAVAVASAIVVAGWHATFAGNGWWIAGASAAVLALMVAIVARDAGIGAEMVFLILLVGYLVVAGPLAAGSLAFHGWATVTGGLTGTGDGFRALLTTHPPVTAQGAALLPPLISGLVTAGIGASVATATPRPAAPLVPVVAMFVLVLLMGQHEDTERALLGVAMGVLVVVWLWVRSRRLDRVAVAGSVSSRSATALAMLVVLVGGGLAVVTVGGADGAGRYLARDSADPYPVAGLRTPLDDFRQFTAQNPGARDNVYDAKLFQVKGLEPGARLRFAALDTYHGQSWTADNNTDPLRFDDRFLHVSTRVRNPSSGEVRTVQIRATGSWYRPWLPTFGAVQSFDFSADGPSSSSDDAGLGSSLRYDPATGTAVLPAGLEGGVGYSIRTRDDDLLADRTMTASPDYNRRLWRDLAGLDPVIDYFKGVAYTPLDAVFKVAAGMRRVGFTSDGAGAVGSRFRSGQDLRRLTDDFLLATPTVGDEEQYAAALALLATRSQVPARVVVGAIVPKGGAVYGSDVTAWVEVRIDDGTWRTIPPSVFMPRRAFVLEGTGLPSVRNYLAKDPNLRPDAPKPRKPRKADATREGDGVPWGVLGLGTLVLLGLAIIVAAPLAKWRRRRRRWRAARPSTRIAGAWEELVDHARDLGVEVPVATRPVQAEALDRGRSLAREADRRIYSTAQLSDAEAAAFWELVGAELHELDDGATRWRRLRARFSPASLRRR